MLNNTQKCSDMLRNAQQFYDLAFQHCTTILKNTQQYSQIAPGTIAQYSTAQKADITSPPPPQFKELEPSSGPQGGRLKSNCNAKSDANCDAKVVCKKSFQKVSAKSNSKQLLQKVIAKT